MNDATSLLMLHLMPVGWEKVNKMIQVVCEEEYREDEG